ncbi:helix-turn-helix domain-containing protein [Nocardia sp. ET3-3]|uniref:Helix-turn-helix domain-containing protein n=1 Tax=Nocardia terrae TaxID=2675851 RepID=A0A7K1UUU0_9NOCA|nr:helix-turn-helix domain-containing protein [Nocardia terrae]MVU78137.1 helix-turn-helix domain-containing protein [Nocardia terrae]
MDVAVLLADGVGDLGLASVLEVFKVCNSLLRDADSVIEPWHVHLISAQVSVRSGNGYEIATSPLAEAEVDTELLIVPANSALDADTLVRSLDDPATTPLLHYISATHAAGVHLAAACTGTFYLAEAGALDGTVATTSWWLAPAFRRRYPRVDLHDAETLCAGTQVTTAGAVLAHLDLALSLVARRTPELAFEASRYLLAGDRRNQRAAAIPGVIARGDSLIANFECWVRDHLAEPFQIVDAARALGVTARSLQRAAQAELGMSPGDFVNEIRLQRATTLLQTTDLTVEAVAGRVGYQNAGTLRTLFRRRRGQTITEVRSTPLHWTLTSSHR